MTTCVFKNDILAADKMVVSIERDAAGNYKKIDGVERITKLFIPKDLTFQGERVLAGAFAGSLMIATFIQDIFFNQIDAWRIDIVRPKRAKRVKRKHGTKFSTGFDEYTLLFKELFLTGPDGGHGYYRKPDEPPEEEEPDPNLTEKLPPEPAKEKNPDDYQTSVMLITPTRAIIHSFSAGHGAFIIRDRSDLKERDMLLGIGSGGRSAVAINRIVSLPAIDTVLAASVMDVHTGLGIDYIDLQDPEVDPELVTIPREDYPDDLTGPIVRAMSVSYYQIRLHTAASRSLAAQKIAKKSLYPTHDVVKERKFAKDD